MRLLLSLVIGLLLLAPIPAPVGAQTDSTEATFWESVRDSKTPAELEAYLKAYPQGKFAPLARIRLKSLKSGAIPAEKAGTAFKPLEKQITVRLGFAKNDPSKGWMGAKISNLTTVFQAAFKLKDLTGVLIVSVAKEGPADRAGIAAGNIVVAVGGTPVANPQTLARLVAERGSDEDLTFKLVQLAKTPAELMQILHRKASESTDGVLANSVAQIYARGNLVPKDAKEAFRFYKLAAQKGHAGAMTDLGFMYERGKGVAKDEAEAVRWYRKAAEKGHVVAMTNLGNRYRSGQGIAKDMTQAHHWWKKAASMGNAAAMNNLGAMYYWGKGVEKNAVKAGQLFKKCTSKGSPQCMQALGWLHDKGDGVEKDSRKAADLMFRALKAGDIKTRQRMLTQSESWSLAFRHAFQLRMKQAGIYNGTVDGKFGPATKTAINSLVANAAKKKQAPRTKAAPSSVVDDVLKDMPKLEKLEKLK